MTPVGSQHHRDSERIPDAIAEVAAAGDIDAEGRRDRGERGRHENLVRAGTENDGAPCRQALVRNRHLGLGERERARRLGNRGRNARANRRLIDVESNVVIGHGVGVG
jgi:hypothetical protein